MKKHFRTVTLCLLLALLMAVLSPLQVFAASKRLYISELRMADSMEKLEALGYTVLDTDLNAGGNDAFTYIGYKTTDNPDEAITDISVMDMKGGYSFGDYEKMLERQKEEVAALVEKYKVAISEFREEYKRGAYTAVEAFQCLNNYIEDDSGKRIGDLLIDENLTDDELIKIFMQGSVFANGIILMCLAAGLVQVGDECWLDRIPEPYEISADYYDEANAILPQVESLRNLMTEYLNFDLSIFEENSVLTIMNEFGEQKAGEYLDGGVIYEALNARKHGEGTLADLFLKPDLTAEELYPIASALSPGQLAIAETSGLEMLIKAVNNGGEVWDEAKALTEEQGMEVTVDAPVSIYLGTDRSLYEGGVALTSDAKRKSASTGDTTWAYGNMNSSLEFGMLMSIPAVALVGALIASNLAATTLMTPASAVGTAAFIETGATAVPASTMPALVEGGLISAAPGAAPQAAVAGGISYGTMAFATVFITLAVILVLVGVYLGLEYAYYRNPSYSDVPLILMDLKYGEDDEVGDWEKYVRYDVVRDEEGNCADLNQFSGKQWNAMYTTKDKAAGDPITAEAFMAKYGDSATPRGSYPVHYFGSVDAFDLNSHCFNNDVGGIFLFFQRDSEAFASTSASVFGSGAMSIVTGFGGLMLGAIGTVLLTKRRLRENNPNHTASA